MPVAHRQLLQVARALAFDCRLLALDEPTTSLTAAETDHLFRILADLTRAGVTIVYVSHRLPEVFRLCDRITVLRDGRVVETFVRDAVSHDAIVRAMVGRSIPQRAPTPPPHAVGEPRLRVSDLTRRPCFEDVSLSIAPGEIVGLFGLVGSGRTEILESFITQKVDGIAISCLNGDFLTDTINRAVDAGIPVTTWDADAPKSKRLAFYGVDDLAAGRILAEQAVTLLGGKGKVAIITSIGATNLQRRLDGVKEVLARHNGITVVEVYDIKEDPVHCAEIIAAGTNRYPDLAAWIAVGGWPVFTRNALAAVPARTKVISFDTIPPAPDLLKEGKVQVRLGQKYFG
jgi:energy-coupling factor transporter ATP-binding protein EcfA2